MKRYFKAYGSQSRKITWSNAKQFDITKGSHIYAGSNGCLDFFEDRLTRKEISIQNRTFNNTGSL
tara:strand:- start:396 stop:590 length:195 start_codon:yes stop_codon:yes gene_type:complete